MKKTILIPGNTYTVEEFASSLKNAKGAKKKFIKQNGGGYYSHSILGYVNEATVKKLIDIVDDEENIYKHFNIAYMPTDIIIEKVSEDVEDIKSSNIYDKMAAKTIGHFKGSFKVKINYTEKPITVVREWSKDITLSMRDIVNFM